MERQDQRRFWAAFAALGAAALALRAYACLDAFWLDEIWSWEQARAATSALELLDRIHRENSHYVTTLWIYLVGDTPLWWLYRVPSLLAGCLLVPLAALPLRRESGGAAALAAAALFGGSAFLITYASEARGYAGVMLHALLVYRLLEAEERRPSPSLEWAVGACLLAGALWQPVFLLVWCAASLWGVAARLPFPRLLRMLAPPWAALGTLFALGFRLETAAQGPVRPKLTVLWGFLKAASGSAGPGSLTSLLAAALILAVALSFARRPAFETRRIAGLRLLLCVVPVAGILAAPSQTVYERYFAAALPLLYLSALYGAFTAAPRAGWALPAALLAANLNATRVFLADGRGHYLEALREMAENSPRGEGIRWVTDHPFRNAMLVRFYARYVPEARFEQVAHKDMGERPAPWAIIHQIEDDAYAAPPPAIPVAPHTYRFVRTFAKSGLSGFRWHLYALDGSLSAAPTRP